MKIYNLTEVFDFNSLSLAHPGRLQGGSHYSKIKYNNENLYLQTSKCLTKNGIVVTGKKTYCDLMFKLDDTEMVDWILECEKTLKKLLFNKSELWFQNELCLDDIEYFFNSSLRLYKSNNQLMRTYVNTNKNSSSSLLQIFDENETIKQYEDVYNKNIISILHLKGVKFTSTSFQIDIELKQILILDDDVKMHFNKCMITHIKKMYHLTIV